MLEGRYLLGVEPIDRTVSFLERSAKISVEPQSLRARCEAAIRVRSSREPLSQTWEPCPDDLAAHLSLVRARPVFQSLFQNYEAEFALVDLASLVPVQPHVDFSFALEATADLSGQHALADLCLPTAPQALDVWGGVTDANGSGAFTVCSYDLNLIVSEVHMDTTPSLKVSFTLSKTAVFLIVVETQGRLFLKDGTHRAVGLLARGFAKAPCVLLRGAPPRSIPDYLPAETQFGPSPPLLSDFLDGQLYLSHPWIRGLKTIRIRADEFVMPRDPADLGGP